MKDYLLLFRSGIDIQTASPEQLQNTMIKWQEWLGKLEREKKLAGGQRLTSKGKTLTGSKKDLIDGPFSEGKEVVGGYQLIKARSLEDAVEVARGCPIFEFGGSVEVRETMAN
jgi:hypothetical protein